MQHLVVDLNKALDMVKKARPCIKPNAGFMKQLKQWEKKVLEENIDGEHVSTTP